MKLLFHLLPLCTPNNKIRRGLIKKIADKTQLERHKIADLLHGRTQYLSLETLGKICDYLVQHCRIDPEDLPGLLFARAVEDFWQLLNCRHLTVCLGMRRHEGEDMITSADVDLQRALLHEISSLTVGKPRFESLDHFLVVAPSLKGKFVPNELHRVKQLYAEFSNVGERALVALGSNKINPVSERIIAGCFGAEPFVFDAVGQAGERRCPLVVAYRKKDPRVPSCCGDTRLCKGKPFRIPGIHYERPDGEWDHVPWIKGERDAAFVLYDRTPGRVQMVLAGFSARASRSLGEMLKQPKHFWPPCFAVSDRQVGVFVIDFRFQDEHDTNPTTEVIRLHESVIARRLAK